MDKTDSDLGQTGRRDAIHKHPALIVGYHPRREFLGSFLLLREANAWELGRGSNAFGEGRMDDRLVSRQHLGLQRGMDAIEARDLGSRNGTILNGSALTEPTVLCPGDVLAMGRICLVYQLIPVFHRVESHNDIIGTGPSRTRLLEQIAQTARVNSAVLVQGEAGVGKELVARAIHDQSGRKGHFVAVNCGAVADGVVHSELFGHLRGAFSGASDTRAGLVKDAEGGTLLLDEIGDASPAFQVALLRLLEQKEFRAVGSDRTQKADVRIVAATHVPLRSAVEAGSFRHDLFTRISERIIDVPPLRSRPEDVVPIAYQLLALEGHHQKRISRPMAQELLVHDWPGNVRELRSVIQRALSDGSEDELLISEPLRPSVAPSDPMVGQTQRIKVRPQARPNADELRYAFHRLNGNMQALAKELGIGRNTLYRWFREAQLDPSQLRSG
jgi:transcriptional regulator with PAS, ATPase and Fis domain